MGDKLSEIRNGQGYRAQCEGNLWEMGLNAWIAVEEQEDRRKKEKVTEEKTRRTEGGPSAKRPKVAAAGGSDPEEADHKVLVQKLWMGLGLLKCLAENIHTGVNKNNPEPGIAADNKWRLQDCSLLVSTPSLLEQYPAPRHGLPDKTRRFPADLRTKPPPPEAAPAAVKGGLLS